MKDAYKIEIEELTGGHSGQEIHKSRANSIKIADTVTGVKFQEKWNLFR